MINRKGCIKVRSTPGSFLPVHVTVKWAIGWTRNFFQAACFTDLRNTILDIRSAYVIVVYFGYVFNFKCWLLLFFSGFWWCACTGCGWSQFDRFWYRVSILWLYLTKHAHSVVGFRLVFFRLSPRGYSPGHPVFPFSQTNNSIWNTRTLSNGCLTSRFCFMGNKDLKLVNGNHEVLLGGWRGGGGVRGLKVKICCQLGLQTLTLFKTKKKNVHFACSPTLSRALIISRLTWLNAALDNRHNQINNVAFIWGL